MAYVVKAQGVRVSGKCKTKAGAARRAKQFSRTIRSMGGRVKPRVFKSK